VSGEERKGGVRGKKEKSMKKVNKDKTGGEVTCQSPILSRSSSDKIPHISSLEA